MAEDKIKLWIKGNKYMNGGNVSIANIESLLEGCYHEMGHVLATLHYFPNGEAVMSISFVKKQNGGFCFYTNYQEIQWSFPSQIEALIMCCIGGGIFQQIKLLNCKLKKHPVFDVLSYIRLHYGLRKYLIKHTQCPIDGMEGDMAYLCNMYSKILRYKKNLEPLNLEKEKEKTIDLLMPYLNNKKVDELCQHIVDKIMVNCGACDTIIEMKEILAYLGGRGSEELRR